MASVIDFRDHAVASLRARVAAAEETNRDLIAFARGHSGAVASIHAAVLAIVETEGLDHLLHVATQDWTDMLRVDAIAVALVHRGAEDKGGGEAGLIADADGVHAVDAPIVRRLLDGVDGVVLRGVDRGDPLFGPACPLIRAEALIRLDGDMGVPGGVLALGQRAATRFETLHGSELLAFLGAVLVRRLARWLP